VYACLGRGAVISVTIARDHPLDISATRAYADARHNIVRSEEDRWTLMRFFASLLLALLG